MRNETTKISATTVRELKKKLRENNLAPAIALLAETTDVDCFKLFKEHKLLLIPLEFEPLFIAYKSAAERLISDPLSYQYEQNYLEFLKVYLLASRDLEKEVKLLIAPYLSMTTKEFLVLISVVVDIYIGEIVKGVYGNLPTGHSQFTAEQLSELNERRNNETRGRANDFLFAISNLISFFSKWKLSNDYETPTFRPLLQEEEVEKLHSLVYRVSNINSYQYAYDRISYGECVVQNVGWQDKKPVFTLKVLDERLEKAREFGLSREAGDLYIKKEKFRWFKELLKPLAEKMFEEVWEDFQHRSQLFFTNNVLYDKIKQRVLSGLEQLDADDEILVGSNAEHTEIFSAYISALLLYIQTVTANHLKKNSAYLFTCPEITPQLTGRLVAHSQSGRLKPSDNTDMFISKFPLFHYLNLFERPYIKDNAGKVFAVDFLVENGWINAVRAALMKGGTIADRAGKAWETYIAGVMRENHWDHVVENVILKKDGQTITDIDLVAKRGDTLYVIQVKVYYGNGINHFEQWKFRQKLEYGVKQVKISSDAIDTNPYALSRYFTAPQLAEIRRTQPLIITNAHYYNGWQCDGVPVMSTGSLMQIINGATVRFMDIDGKVLDSKQYAASDVLSNEEIFSFLETPLDWRIGSPIRKLEHHIETLDHAVLKFPYYNQE